MKRENILLIIVGLLVIMNGTILFLFLTKEDNHRPPPPDKIIIETLQLDNKQQLEFEKLKLEHRKKLRAINDALDKNLEDYFKLLQSKLPNQSLKDSIDTIMASLEREKIRVTYDHFKDLKNLCRDDQKEKFDQFIPQLIKFILRPQPPKRKGPPERRD